MKEMEIKTTTRELVAVIGVAGSYAYDGELDVMKKVRETFSDEEFTEIVALLSKKIVDHLTGEEQLDKDLLAMAQYITRVIID